MTHPHTHAAPRVPASARGLLIAAFALFTIGAAQAQTPQHLALVTDLGGAVTVQRAAADAAVPATWGMQLFEGDRVATAEGGRASILFASNNLVTLGQNSSMTIASNPAGAAPAAAPAAAAPGPLLTDISGLTVHRTGRGEIAALGGLRSAGAGAALEPLAPRHSKVVADRPTFAWRAADGFDLFTVRVFDDGGLVWEGEADADGLVYPADAPALVPERSYLWQVEGASLLESETSPLVPFTILTADAREAVSAQEDALRTLLQDDPSGSTLHFALGAYYAQTGLLTSAISSFEAVAAHHPEAPLPFEILGSLYREVGRKDAAIRAFEQALALSQQ